MKSVYDTLMVLSVGFAASCGGAEPVVRATEVPLSDTPSSGTRDPEKVAPEPSPEMGSIGPVPAPTEPTLPASAGSAPAAASAVPTAKAVEPAPAKKPAAKKKTGASGSCGEGTCG